MRKTEAKPGGDRLMECSHCEGRGYYWAPKKTTCKICNGKGFVARKQFPPDEKP